MNSKVQFPLRILALLLVLGLPGLATAADDVVSVRLAQFLDEPAGPSRGEDGVYGIWVYFADRDLEGANLEFGLQQARGRFSERTLNRRAKAAKHGEDVVTEHDLPVAAQYLDAVKATGAEFRRESRWLNAASFNATVEQIEVLKDFPFVTSVDMVAQFWTRPVIPTEEALAALEEARTAAAGDKNLKWSLDYGGSLEQAEMINLPPVHEAGLDGTGVIVGVIDTGFEFTHEAMQNVDVLATYDFVNNDTDVSDGPSDPDGQAAHGTELLSLLAGFKDGDMVGVAYNASFILAKTEEIDREHPVEEDNAIAAIEWMESLGTDVVSSQVGYVDWYNYSDMDGLTAPITIAYDMAATLGVVVVTSAGDLNGEVGLPPLMAPADGRHVITVGSVMLDEQVFATSSRGPTYDGRIKPDLMAMGAGPVVASYLVEWLYPNSFGSSYATAQVAGVVTLMLERLPNLTPWQVREALRMTASQAGQPDNDYGWGIADAQAAINYWGPVIEHEPLGPSDQVGMPRTVTARITSRQEVDPQSVLLTWRQNFGPWERSLMTASGNGIFTGQIPPLAPGAFGEYYLEAVDLGGLTLTHPWAGVESPHFYSTLGSDNIVPTLQHTFLMDQRLPAWPPTVRASATDNMGVASVALTYSVSGGLDQGPFPLSADGENFELDFPLDPSGLLPGDVVTYKLTATDVSENANTTEVGPFDFDIVDLRARVLIIDDLSEHKSDKNGSLISPRGSDSATYDKTFHSPMLIEGWLLEAGYQVDMILSSQVVEGSLEGYPVVILSSGQTFFPITLDVMRSVLIDYVANGGRLLVEGGETAYTAGVAPGYPDFLEKVLHTSEVLGEGGYLWHQTPGNEGHAFLHRPNPMPDTLFLGILPGEVDYRASDIVQPTVDAGLVYSTSFTSTSGGILFYDENTGPDQGQVVFFPFSINFYKDAVGRLLVENALAYLLTEELPGRSAITGQVLLSGASDHSGITVSTDSLHTTVTDAAGNYTLEGLWGGEVVLTASKDGYGSESLDIFLVDDQIYPAETLILTPIATHEYQNATPAPVPDNDPTGIDSFIEVTADGALHSIVVSVDISHYSINNLTVTLTSPAGTSVTLHNRTGGTANDLVGSWPDVFTVDGPGALTDYTGEEVQGTWTLNVADHQFGAIGTLNFWGLTLEVVSSRPTSSGGNPSLATRIVGNSPNPFNPRTVISFELARTGPVHLDVYDLGGRLVRTLVASDMPAGLHQVTWDGLDRKGRMSASGIYFTKLRADGQAQVNKMTLVR